LEVRIYFNLKHVLIKANQFNLTKATKMKKLIPLTLFLIASNVYATNNTTPTPASTQNQTTNVSSTAANLNHNALNTTSTFNNHFSDTSQDMAISNSSAGAYANPTITSTHDGSNTNSTASSGNSTIVNSSDNVNYPNQAPPIYTTSSPSFSQRNCTPVGSVNASSPFGGLGVAMPMGGTTCDALNIADLVAQWSKDTNNQRLWLVQCNLMVSANDDLEEAFEKSKYSCEQAYKDRVAALQQVNAQVKPVAQPKVTKGGW
jgi:hypothetical protein